MNIESTQDSARARKKKPGQRGPPRGGAEEETGATRRTSAAGRGSSSRNASAALALRSDSVTRDTRVTSCVAAPPFPPLLRGTGRELWLSIELARGGDTFMPRLPALIATALGCASMPRGVTICHRLSPTWRAVAWPPSLASPSTSTSMACCGGRYMLW